MESDDLLSKTNERRMRNLRAVIASYEQQTHLATELGWTPSYLSQLVGPNPTRPISEKTARHVEQKLELENGFLDSQPQPPNLKPATSGDLLENVMLTVDSCQSAAGWKLSPEKYRALISHLHKAASKHGNSKVDPDEVDALLRLVR